MFNTTKILISRVKRNEVASVVSDSVRPHRRQLTRLPHPRDSSGKNTGVGCHFLLQCMKMKSESPVRLLATPWTAAYQAPLSMGFSRQESWSGVPSPSLVGRAMMLQFPKWSDADAVSRPSPTEGAIPGSSLLPSALGLSRDSQGCN